MSRKAERAKLSRTAVSRAFDDRQAIRISRSIRGADAIEGFVVAVGIRWLLVHRISADLDLDGYTAVRWKHIERATPLGPDHVAVRGLANRRITPRARPEVDPTTTGMLLRSVVGSFDVVAIRPEARDATTCWIGPITGVSAKSVSLAPIDRDGRYLAESVELPFKLITRVDLGTRYQTGLSSAAAAGGAPRLSAVS